MSADTQALGQAGERYAEQWLIARGWRVLARRFRSGHRDLDLVVERSGTVAFVEVKARRSRRCGDPIEAVDWRKRRELARSANVWISRYGNDLHVYRFDVIGVVIEGGRVRVRHVENAFPLPRSS